jgi:hypothetical protein
MGLDMYLTKKTYIGANYPHNEVQGSVSIRTKEGPVNVKLNRITEIIEEVGYWRKANAIHGWFVENVQGGEDDCRAYEVELSQLLELKAIILKIQNAKGKKRESLAMELLPPCDGFFFGSEKNRRWLLARLAGHSRHYRPSRGGGRRKRQARGMGELAISSKLVKLTINRKD